MGRMWPGQQGEWPQPQRAGRWTGHSRPGLTQAWPRFHPRETRVLPALGAAWADQLLLRLMMDRRRAEEGPRAAPSRTLGVLFAPHLPPAACSYDILAEGVRGTPGSESCGGGAPPPQASNVTLSSASTRPRPAPPQATPALTTGPWHHH